MKELDQTIHLALLEAAGDPEVLAAVDDYWQRVEENRPYEDARPLEDVLDEVSRRLTQRPPGQH